MRLIVLSRPFFPLRKLALSRRRFSVKQTLARWTALGSLVVGGLGVFPVHAQDAPGILNRSPQDGGEFAGTLEITFNTLMADTIAITFSAGEWDCHWKHPAPGFPNMILECVPQTTLPAGTITYTLNPDGTGFASVDGVPLPTTTGTFVIPEGGPVDVRVTPFPEDGGTYCPDAGAVTFTFDQPMKLFADAEITPGNWDLQWRSDPTSEENPVFVCTLQGPVIPGATYTWVLNGTGVFGFESQTGKKLPRTTGTFTVPADCGGEALTVTPAPADGEEFCVPNAPVTFTFDRPMKSTWTAEITPGNWTYQWVLDPTQQESPVFICQPEGALTPGVTYTWVLNGTGSGFESVEGEVLPTTTGSFTVPADCEGGGGGDEPPSCPSDSPALPLPKTLFLCGELGNWNSATAMGLETGIMIWGTFHNATGEHDTLALLDAQGNTRWKAAAADSTTELRPGTSSDQILAIRGGDALTTLDLGLFEGATRAPLFRKQFSAASPKHQVIQLPDGRIAVLQTFNDHLELALLTASGDLAWARRYDSADFSPGATVGLPGMGNETNASLDVLDDGMVITFTKSETQLEGQTIKFNQTLILLRLGNDGALRWARKYAGLEASTPPSVWVTDSGEYFVTLLETDTSDPLNPSFQTSVFKLDTAGNPVWGRKFSDANLHPGRVLADGRILLMGSLFTAGVTQSTSDAVLVMLNSNGTLAAQARLDAGDSDFAYVTRVSDRLYLTFVASTFPQIGLADVGPQTEDFSQTVYVGSANLQLRDFQWRKYREAMSYGGLFPSPEGAPMVFSAFDMETHELDVFTVNDDLTPNTACPVFETGGPAEKPSALIGAPVTLSATDAAVTSAAQTLSLGASDLALETCTWVEQDLCGGQEPPTPPTLAIQSGADGVTLTFATVSGQTYTLQKTPRIKPAAWQDVETVDGTGGTVSRTYPAEGQTAFFRVLATRN